MKVAVLGFGTVGQGVYGMLAHSKGLEPGPVLVRAGKDNEPWKVADMNAIVSDASVGAVAEVMGGVEPAFSYCAMALKAGKHVVTSNKALVAARGIELAEIAREHGAAFLFSAACGGGVPFLHNLSLAVLSDRIESLGGILNGTTNYMLDAMQRRSLDYGAALADAQKLGYAEADPSADIDGLDIQRKAVISANVSFDACLSEADVPVFGIRSILSCDIAAAESRSRICKMLAFGEKSASGAVSCYVEPCFVPSGELEAAVSTNRNVISFVTELTGKESFYGQGAGRYPTAYNAVADCADIIGGVKEFYTSLVRDVPVDNNAASHPYYVRFSGSDEFLSSIEAEKCGEGVVTMPVPVAKMHAWAAKAKEADPGVFIAGLI